MGNAERQARWRAKRNALARSHPDVIERELVQAAEGFERLPERERLQLADRLADAAMVHLRRSQELSRVAMKVRAGER